MRALRCISSIAWVLTWAYFCDFRDYPNRSGIGGARGDW